MYKFNPMFYADVRVEDRYETRFGFKSEVLDSFKVRTELRAFIRVYDGAMWYYAATSEPERVQEELDKLYAQATPNPAIADDKIVRGFQVNVEDKHIFRDCSVRDVPKDTKLQLLRDYFPYTHNEYVKMCMFNYVDRHSEYTFCSSKGSDVSYDFQLCGWSASLSMASDTEQFMDAVQIGESTFDALRGHEDMITEYVARMQDYLLNAVPCVRGDFPVVISPLVAGVFAHESFGHKSESDFMLGDETMAREWAIGTQVGSPLLSIVDTGTIPGSGYTPFDDDGTRATETYLIRDGILSGRLHSAVTAAVMGETVTGNARALNCKFEPIVRMTTTYIEAGDSTVEELIAGVQDGYYIHSLKHGSGMSQFTIAPSLAYEIKDGKIARPTKISVLTGSVFETLGLIDGVSDRRELFSFVMGGCGKMEQQGLPVGFGGPYVRVSKMNVQ